MLVTPFGMVISVRLVQPSNTPPPMLVTLLGIVILASFEQLLNAFDLERVHIKIASKIIAIEMTAE